MESMDDILKEPKTETTEVTEEAPTQERAEVVEKPTSRRRDHLAKEYEAQGRDPSTGQFVPKEAPKEEPKEAPKTEVKVEAKKEEFTEKERAFLRGLEEERRKRQDLERQIAELRKPKEDGEKKTFWDDPEGHFKTVEQRIAQREVALTLKVSEQIARSKYNDFDQNIEVFAEILKSPAGPGIHQQFLSAPDPAEFAYRLGKHTKEVREAGSVEDLRAKIEKETRVKLEAEFKQKQEDLEKERKALPPSLSDVRGGGRPNQPVWSGPTPMSEVLK